MKKFLQVLAIFIVSTTTLSAQWVTDSISMGPGYSNNVFYALGNGVQQTSVSTDWHIAFSMNGNDSASVFANQTGSSTSFFTRVYDVNRPISDWANVSYADTLTGTPLYNGEQGWYQGAFNDVPSNSVVDFGWGIYDPLVTHKFVGTRLFIVATGGQFYKLAIDSMNPYVYDWSFRIEPLGPSLPPSISYTVSKSNGFSDRLFAYFNIDSGTAKDREPNINNWDFQFIGYPSYVQAGPQSAYRVVTGALTNRGLPVAEAQAIHVDTAVSDYLGWPRPTWMANWESNPYTTIGYDWKTFDLGTFSYIVPDSLTYFIEAKNDSVYQLQFLSFGGAQTGKVNFRYRNLGSSPVAVNDVQLFGEASLYPNPAANKANFLFNAKKGTQAMLTITSYTGQVLVRTERIVNQGLNAFEINTSNLPTGNYIISLQNAEGVTSKKMTINR